MRASGAVSAQAVSILTCEDEGATILLPMFSPPSSSSLPASFSHHNMAVVRLRDINPCTRTHKHAHTDNCHFPDTAISHHRYPDESNEASQHSIKHTHSLTWARTTQVKTHVTHGALQINPPAVSFCNSSS